MSEDEVAAELRDGMTVGVGGWGSRRKPMSLIRAIARSPVTGLTLVSYGGPDVGLLCRAGKVKRVVFAFVSLDVCGGWPSRSDLQPAERSNATSASDERNAAGRAPRRTGYRTWFSRVRADRIDLAFTRASEDAQSKERAPSSSSPAFVRRSEDRGTGVRLLRRSPPACRSRRPAASGSHRKAEAMGLSRRRLRRAVGLTRCRSNRVCDDGVRVRVRSERANDDRRSNRRRSACEHHRRG